MFFLTFYMLASFLFQTVHGRKHTHSYHNILSCKMNMTGGRGWEEGVEVWKQGDGVGGGRELTKVDMPLHSSPLCWDQGSAQGRAWAVFHTWVGWWAWGGRCSPPCGACSWWCLWTSQVWPPWSCRCGAGLFHTFPAHKSETVSLRLPREEHW